MKKSTVGETVNKLEGVKQILFRMNIEGQGIVNFDSNDQKYMCAKTSNLKTTGKQLSEVKNTSYGKKNFYVKPLTEDEKLRGVPVSYDYRLKISGDCLRHEIFSKYALVQTSNIIHNPVIFMAYIASPVSLLRGYLFANKAATYRRKGPLTLTDAEQIESCTAKSWLETHSTSGEKESKKDENGLIDADMKSGTSFFSKENVGKIQYASKGSLNLNELRFISVDAIFGRESFNADHFEQYKLFLNSQFMRFDDTFEGELGYYKIGDSVLNVPELGFVLSDENLVTLTKILVEEMATMSIDRNTSYAKTSKLEMKYVVDSVRDTLSSEDGWIEISSQEDIDNISFNSHHHYALQTDNFVEERVKMEKMVADAKVKLKGKKVSEREALAEKKALAETKKAK